MHHFNRWNNITGWFVFLVAAVVYLLTLEPTVSYWDCGEFISCAYKQQIGHPPGAPLYLLLAKVFSLITSDPSKVALAINAFSALSSAFTILFLFWTITHLARKIIAGKDTPTTGKIILILGSGLVGAFAFTFSDSFWFSAVEAEVYATSSLFTAVVFWAILKWENNAGQPYANRWLILIAYLMGLSIGVHLLNLLTIPALALVVYYKKFRPTWWGVLTTVFVSFLILGFVQYGVISGLVRLAGTMELFFVNTIGFPYLSGIIFYIAILTILLIVGLWFTYSRNKYILNTVFLAFTLFILGYASYAMIVIRSDANPPINENQPDGVFSLLSYLNREQYGSSPLFYGAYYNAPVIKTTDGEPTYVRANGKYVVVDRKQVYVYDPRFYTFFPRMYSRETDHIRVYKEWGHVKGKPVTINRDEQQVVEYLPRFRENLTFFLQYQVGYMYFRYFMWNFAGKQNGLDGNGGILNGNWMTGFSFLDSKFLGPQDKLPTYLKDNKGRNRYFLLPLIFGMLGLLYQFGRSRKDFSVILMLFLMTGIAIVVYLNQTPLQPRERDYAYIGSFYAYAIWIGLGVAGLADIFRKWFSEVRTGIVASVIGLIAVPAVMASQNWDDHDRSGRYTARDVAYNYLNSCAPNAILFTNGDNDTFPLWYLQEVEGIRTDVRVVNLTLLEADWYISQQKRKIYNNDGLPVSLAPDQYLSRKRSYVYLLPKDEQPLSLREAISFVASDNPMTKLKSKNGKDLSFLSAKNFVLPVPDSMKNIDSLQNQLTFTIAGSTITKSDLILFDILVQNRWKRPVYFASHHTPKSLGLSEYLQLDGFAYRLVPVSTKNDEMFSYGRIESSVLYDNLMNKFRWDSMNDPDVYIDDYNVSNFALLKTRIVFSRLARQLYSEGKKDSAYQVLKKCLNLMPSKIYPHDYYSIPLLEAAYFIGSKDLAHQIIREFSGQCFEELKFYYGMSKHQFELTLTKNVVAQQTIAQIAEIAEKNADKSLRMNLELQLKAIIGN